MSTINPTWGYKPDGSAHIFDLAPGEGLPDGWHDSPACITDPALATADALSAALQGRAYVPAVADPVSGFRVNEAAAVDPDALANALAEIDRLKGVIEAGMAENERLASELDEADKLLGAAADSYKKATDDLAAFSEQLAKAHEDTRVNAAERDAAKAAVEALTADLAQAKADLEAATAPKPATTTKGR